MSFSFGTPSSAPATGLSSGFSFGGSKPATPGFSLGATSQPSTGLFGTPATSAPAFGTATSAFGPTSSFGATSTAPTFGANTFGATNPPAFGATSTAPAFGSTATPAFGATSTAPTFGASTTPAFGATATPAFGATATPAFGAAATPAFGTTATPAFGVTSAAPAFGTTTTPAFGATSTPAFGAATSLSFGSTTAPTFGTTSLATGGLNFGTGTTTTASTGLSFGLITTSAGFGFGTTTTTAASTTNQWSFSSTSTATTTASLFGAKFETTNVTGTQPSVSATPSLGLGGGAQTSGATSTATDGKSEPPKQTKLPNEIQTTVDSFKDFVKKQKSISSDIMRTSDKPLYKVSREAESTLRATLALRAEIGRARAQSKRLRSSAAAALAAAEITARDPPELEGTTPPVYVKNLISELEELLIIFRRQMDEADKLMQSSPRLLSEQELTLGIRRMHESLVVLAGRLQGVHLQVEAQKEQYLNLRKYILKDPTNVFDDPTLNTTLDQILRDAEGKKKSKMCHISDIGMGNTMLSGNLQHLAGPTPFTYMGTVSPYPALDASGPNWQPQPQSTANSSLNISGFGSTTTAENNSFQLQKPPGKRGKQ